MKSSLGIIFILLTFISTISAQENVKFIKATSQKVAIKDGNQPISKWWDYLRKDVRPVVYHISKINQNRRVIFYTDIDSIVFDVTPNSTYNFRVLLNAKDTCYAKISTVIPSYYKEYENCKITRDTIPFLLGTDNYIHIKGKVNNSETLDFIFDTGAGVCLLNERGQKIVQLNLDGQTDNEGSSGFTVEQTSSSNHLQLSLLNWNNLPLLYIDYQNSINTDGVIGFNIFEDKVVEIDYEKNILIVHSQMPTNITGYSKHQLKHDNNGTFIEATLNNGTKDFTGWYLFDTGGNMNVMVGGDYATKNNLYGSMKNLGKSKATGNGKGFFENEIVELPILKICGFSISQVPIQLTRSDKNFYDQAGIIGNNILKRLNTLIDYPNATIYLKPNGLINEKFKKKDETTMNIIIGFLIAIPLLVFVVFLFKNSKRNILPKNNSNMHIKLFLGLFITLVGEVAFAQQTVPILKTNTTTLDFKERGILKKGEWQLAAHIELDIYEVSNKNIEQVITIYSDIDSLSITLMPNSVFDFIILWKNQTPFKTRISSRYNTYRKNCNKCVITSDTIPFKYGKGNRILIKGKINDGEDLDFLFDTGAEFIGLYQSGVKKNPNLLFNATGVAIGGGGQFEIKISDDNKLSISNLIWDNKAFYYSGEKLGNYDGVMGYKIFEDKVVEINFDQDIIIAHSSLPTMEQGYTKCRFEKRGELFFIELKLKIGNKTVAEWFDFDTGNTGNINIHDEFATKENLFGLLKKIGESTVKSADGAKRKTDEVILSKVHFGDYEFTDIPIFIEHPSKVENLPFPIVGIELISRFNVIMDYKNNYIYLKPNKYFYNSFKKKDDSKMYIIVGISITVILLGGLFFLYKRRIKS
jgi:predicted aspartyl protease